MEKYLFTDGTNLVREVQSKAELLTLVQSSGDPGKIRIWLFSTSEWISYAEFSKHPDAKVVSPKKTVTPEVKKDDEPVAQPVRLPKPRFAGVFKFFIVAITGIGIFFIYNFTRIKWHTASALLVTAARPANAPLINVDSLVQVIESTRAQKLDKVTLTNLRIRNTWPDRIELKLKTDRDTGQAGTKFYNVEISIDNSTGYNIDNAIVELKEWGSGMSQTIDTIHFNNIGYSALSHRKLDEEYRGDSLSISFLSIKAKSFNFCYAHDKESNYGNFNDRWFCRE